MIDEQIERYFNEVNRRFDNIDQRLDTSERLQNRQIRLSGEIKTAVATASSQVVGAGEAVHAIAHRIELDAVKAEQASLDTGEHQNRMAGKQEQLVDWQLGNAKLTRILLITGIIGTITGGIISVLAFLKWYVHI